MQTNWRRYVRKKRKLLNRSWTRKHIKLPVRYWIVSVMHQHVHNINRLLVLAVSVGICLFFIYFKFELTVINFGIVCLPLYFAAASPNQSLIGSSLSTPQKQQPINKIGVTPQTQPRQALMPVPTARTPINVRSMPPTSSLITPSYGQYRIASPTPVVGTCFFKIQFTVITWTITLMNYVSLNGIIFNEFSMDYDS